MPIPDLSNKPGPGRPGWGPTGSYDFQFEVAAGQVGITILPRVNGQGFTIKWQDETEQTITSAQTDLQSPTTQAGVISINKEGDQTWCDDFAVASGKQFVTKVTSWGQNPWNRLLNAFKDCTNLTEIGTTGLLIYLQIRKLNFTRSPAMKHSEIVVLPPLTDAFLTCKD